MKLPLIIGKRSQYNDTMNTINALILGVVQGLTEFLPVSSSGHLVIVQHFLPEIGTGILFEVIVHAGTMVAILVYFRSRLIRLLTDYWKLLVIATLPAGIVGLLFDDFIESAFGSITFVAVFLLITATFNYFTDRAKGNREQISFKTAFLIGCAQCIAILPGVSRSGSTIFAGTNLGVKREQAAEFSFLLSIPAIVGANFLQIVKYGFPIGESIIPYGVGFLAAFISGYFAISAQLKLLNSKRFTYFSIYCILVSLLLFIFVL